MWPQESPLPNNLSVESLHAEIAKLHIPTYCELEHARKVNRSEEIGKRTYHAPPVTPNKCPGVAEALKNLRWDIEKDLCGLNFNSFRR